MITLHRQECRCGTCSQGRQFLRSLRRIELDGRRVGDSVILVPNPSHDRAVDQVTVGAIEGVTNPNLVLALPECKAQPNKTNTFAPATLLIIPPISGTFWPRVACVISSILPKACAAGSPVWEWQTGFRKNANYGEKLSGLRAGASSGQASEGACIFGPIVQGRRIEVRAIRPYERLHCRVELDLIEQFQVA